VLVVLTTATDPTNAFGINTFDVTPALQGVAGVAEEQIINLFVAANGGGSATPAVTSPSVSLVQQAITNPQTGVTQTTCRVLTTVQPAQSVVLSPAANAAFDNTFSNVLLTPATTTCGAAAFDNAPSITLGDSFTASSCGRRVTLLVGRPYDLTTTTCLNSGLVGNTCLAGTAVNGSAVTEIGNLDFVGNSFFQSNPGGGTFSVFSLDIPSCSCAAAVPLTPCPTPTTPTPTCVCDLGSLAGTLSGLKSTVHNVLTITKKIEKKVKH